MIIATHGKISPERLKGCVKSVSYEHLKGTTTTVCHLTTYNGHVITATSGCLEVADFDFELGKKIAYENAIDKLWELEGYYQRTRRFTLARAHALGFVTGVYAEEDPNNPDECIIIDLIDLKCDAPVATAHSGDAIDEVVGIAREAVATFFAPVAGVSNAVRSIAKKVFRK